MLVKYYKIVSPLSIHYYIGSTIQPINIRLSKHKHDLKRHNEGRYGYCTSFEILQLEDFRIELIEEIEMKDNKQRFRYEHNLIYHYKDNVVNCIGVN